MNVIQDIYEGSTTTVKCAVGLMNWFDVTVGRHQGSAFSPFLFTIIMDRWAN